MNIKCFCDHCTDNTCLLENGVGFCYSEAKLDNDGTTIKKSYNCFKKNDHLIFALICDTKPTSTSNNRNSNTPLSQLRACCNNRDYCNQDPHLLPPDNEILNILKTKPTLSDLKEQRLPDHYHNHTSPQLPISQAGYSANSNSIQDSIGFQVSLFVSSVLLFVVVLASIQRIFIRRHRHKSNSSTGSGAGEPYLTQRSISHDIQLDEVVGRGYYGVVWRGKYKGEPVAVKIFSPVAEPSWCREAEIYQTTMLRHRNLLGFIATDVRHDNPMPGFWLVTDYYPMGSLYDFLRENSMVMQDAYRMAFSIANGLSHLHTEIPRTHISRGKPAIAHRDLKSKNILVKTDGTCCIGDLGMAVRYDSETGEVDAPTSIRVGTRRYLAPELLDGSLDLSDFEGVKACDIYALGLVLWEILRRACMIQHQLQLQNQSNLTSYATPTATTAGPSSSSSSSPSEPLLQSRVDLNGPFAQPNHPPSSLPLPQTRLPLQTQASNHLSEVVKQAAGDKLQVETTNYKPTVNTTTDLGLMCDTYELPYQGYVPLEPTTEEMREIVCVRKIRPPISPRWTHFAPMYDFTKLMSECWYEKPKARLSALRVRKTLSTLAEHHFNQNMEYD